MSVEDIDKIDFVAVDRKTGDVQLVISDHLDWDQNEGEHLFVLQDKLDAYLTFVESGQLYAKFPRTRGEKIVIKVSGKYALSEEAKKLYRLFGKAVQDYGCTLEFVHPKSDEDTPSAERGPA
jgi:hypothetical protein